MKLKISEQKIKYIILLLIPFFIFITIEGTFSVQSIFPMIVLLICVDLAYKKVPKDKLMFIAIGLFLLSTIVSFGFNVLAGTGLINNQTYIRIIYYLVILYFYFSLTSVNYTDIQLKNIFTANIICGALVSIYLIAINHIWLVGLLGTRVDKNFVGAILAVQGEFAVIKFLQTNKLRIKLFAVICYITILFGIFFSASRASVLVIILGTLIIIFFKLKENINTRKGFAKCLFIVFALLIICAIGFNIIASKLSNSNTISQWLWKRYFVNGFGDKSVTIRWVWWDKALSLWKDRFFCGYGIGNINLSGNSSAVTHNTYIDFLLDQGILGFAGFLVIIYRSIFKIIKKRNNMYYGIIITVLLTAMILSATRSVFLWYNLVIFFCISNTGNEPNK